MSLADLFDTTIRVWRPTVRVGTMREEKRTYAPTAELPTAPNAAVNRPQAPLANPGPGLAPVGSRRLYMAAGADVRPRDVLELADGPDAVAFLEVDAAPTAPRGHHVQLDCRVWNGILLNELDDPMALLLDRSGSIAVAGTAQQLAAARNGRQRLLVQNLSAGFLWINFGTDAVQGRPSLRLRPSGGILDMAAPQFVDERAVSIVGAVAGAEYVAKEA